MEALIKIGGSLIKAPNVLRNLCRSIEEIRKDYKICIIPGGSKFADVVREVDMEYKLNNKTAHNMAILGMDQYGFMLNDLVPNSIIFNALEDYEKILTNQKIPIFLPSGYFIKSDPLDNLWSITSDSIAIHIAVQLGINDVIIVTDVDGIFDRDPKKTSAANFYEKVAIKELLDLNQTTCVDKSVGSLLLNSGINCSIVNGYYPERIFAILKGEATIRTLISN